MKMDEHNDLCVGIDLGTTNSVLATINVKPNNDIVSKVVEIYRAVDMFAGVSGEVKLSRAKKPTLPSCVFYREENGYAPLVGEFAKMQYPLRPHLVAKSIKSQMGQALAEGLSTDVPDKTPAQISSQILKHMLRETEKIYKCGEITDAVITVPANFDSAMCKATRDAAELAGIKVRNSDGTERPVLLSEPNAVIYDLINQIQNGDISYHIIDLSQKRNVMVFDLGGGTLDITMHTIQRREDNPEVLKVEEIATNRYTLLGGDDFDNEIAKAMYQRYIKQYIKHPEVVNKLKQNEKVVMPQLRVFAENVKIELNERCGEEYSSAWDDEEDVEIDTGGAMGGIGYAYDDTFTREELENILDVFMGRNLTYNDYTRIESITDSHNIIYPILDVLSKTKDKLNTTDFKVDAVVVNGGMSKFYMIIDRLKDFFGFEPIVALDPDQSVARGAAVYHYYLHKYDEMQEDMKMVGIDSNVDYPVKEKITESEKTRRQQNIQPLAIEWGKNILNDSLYLGLKMGNVEMLIPTGAELPYHSAVKSGFRIEPGQNKVAIPIKSRNIDGTYRTIANGNLYLKNKYPNGAYVSFAVYMAENKVISMQAKTSKDKECMEIIEEMYADIVIDNKESAVAKNKIVAKNGSVLNPRAEIRNILQLCANINKSYKGDRGSLLKRISAAVDLVCAAVNKKDFAEEVLTQLGSVSNTEAKLRLFIIARKMSADWSERDKSRLATLCLNEINMLLMGMMPSGQRVSICIQAIYTLGICGNTNQIEKIAGIHSYSQYKQACLYAHAKSKTSIDWLYEEFSKDVDKLMTGKNSNIQFSVYAIGLALRDSAQNDERYSSEKVIGKICKMINSAKLNSNQLVCCVLAVGWICDQRNENNEIDSALLSNTLAVLRNIEYLYDYQTSNICRKSIDIATKLMNGEMLECDEEEFLLRKLENW